jgi:hypothetical protein
VWGKLLNASKVKCMLSPFLTSFILPLPHLNHFKIILPPESLGASSGVWEDDP